MGWIEDYPSGAIQWQNEEEGKTTPITAEVLQRYENTIAELCQEVKTLRDSVSQTLFRPRRKRGRRRMDLFRLVVQRREVQPTRSLFLGRRKRSMGDNGLRSRQVGKRLVAEDPFPSSTAETGDRNRRRRIFAGTRRRIIEAGKLQ